MKTYMFEQSLLQFLCDVCYFGCLFFCDRFPVLNFFQTNQIQSTYCCVLIWYNKKLTIILLFIHFRKEVNRKDLIKSNYVRKQNRTYEKNTWAFSIVLLSTTNFKFVRTVLYCSIATQAWRTCSVMDLNKTVLQ